MSIDLVLWCAYHKVARYRLACSICASCHKYHNPSGTRDFDVFIIVVPFETIMTILPLMLLIDLVLWHYVSIPYSMYIWNCTLCEHLWLLHFIVSIFAVKSMTGIDRTHNKNADDDDVAEHIAWSVCVVADHGENNGNPSESYILLYIIYNHILHKIAVRASNDIDDRTGRPINGRPTACALVRPSPDLGNYARRATAMKCSLSVTQNTWHTLWDKRTKRSTSRLRTEPKPCVQCGVVGCSGEQKWGVCVKMKMCWKSFR